MEKTKYMITYQSGENEKIIRNTHSFETLRQAKDRADQWYYGCAKEKSLITVHRIDNNWQVSYRDGFSGWEASTPIRLMKRLFKGVISDDPNELD